ncbi:MAG: glutathione peroxidase [Pseudomonadota bacterium]
MLFRRMFLAGAGLATLAVLAAIASQRADAASGENSATSAHQFDFTDIDGNPLPLSQFAGKPLMVVNTASRCGFTYQYDGLQALYDRYREQGFVMLGVPSDDFGGQELATEADVKHFCEVNFSLDFPLAEITHVRGAKAHPFYRWARQELGANNAPRWNFHKYLVAPDGRLVDAFSTGTDPQNPKITSAIEALLAAENG